MTRKRETAATGVNGGRKGNEGEGKRTTGSSGRRKKVNGLPRFWSLPTSEPDGTAYRKSGLTYEALIRDKRRSDGPLPWVKLYAAIWDDPRFVPLPDRDKLIFIGILTLSSHTSNRIPSESRRNLNRIVYESSWIRKRLGLRGRVNLQGLINARLIVPAEDARMMRARRARDIRTRLEGEGDKTILPPTPLAGAGEIFATNESTGPDPESLLAAWNEHRGKLAAASRLTPNRRVKARARLTEQPDIAAWVEVIKRVAGSPFCNAVGRPPGSWRADFDWLLKPDTRDRVMDGAFGCAPPPPPRVYGTAHTRPPGMPPPEPIRMVPQPTEDDDEAVDGLPDDWADTP